jgi:hypothetical protein
MKIKQFRDDDIWIFDDDGFTVVKHLNFQECQEYHKTTEQWFCELLEKYENDPNFIKESELFEIEEKIAKTLCCEVN